MLVSKTMMYNELIILPVYFDIVPKLVLMGTGIELKLSKYHVS